MRTVKVHEEKSIRFTSDAAKITQKLNTYMRVFPQSSFREMAEFFNMSEVNCRRYYYGIHHANNYPNSYSQVRFGASVFL